LTTPPRRLLILSTDDPAAGYGSASALRLFLAALGTRTGWEAVTVVLDGTRSSAQPRARWSRLTRLLWFTVRAMATALGSTERDVVAVLSWQPLPTAVAGLLAARRRGVPHVVRTCGPELHSRWSRFPGLSTAARPITAYLLASADAVVVKSELERRLLPRSVRPDRLHLIPNAVTPAMRASPVLRARSAPVRGLVVAQLEAPKGVDRILHATASATRGRTTDVQLTVVGDGSRRRQIEELARRLDTAIAFLGRVPVEDMPDHYCGHDVLLVGSEMEGCSNACLEALAAGLPVIGSSSALQGLVDDGVNGVLAPRADVDDLSSAIGRFLDSRETWASMSSAARATAAQHRPGELIDCYERMLTRLGRGDRG